MRYEEWKKKYIQEQQVVAEHFAKICNGEVTLSLGGTPQMQTRVHSTTVHVEGDKDHVYMEFFHMPIDLAKQVLYLLLRKDAALEDSDG